MLTALKTHLHNRRVRDRREKLLDRIDIENGIGLEFGPLNKPLISKSDGEVRYVDVKSSDEMRAFIPESNAYKPSEFVNIDYVWNGGRFRDVVGPNIEFDYSIASHVIEHTPNMFGWLDDISSVLKEGGIVSLAIPDKRYTFDVTRPVTSPAIFIDNWIRGETVPRPMHIFDHYSQAAKVSRIEHARLWCRAINPSTIPKYNDAATAFDICIQATSDGSYTDCHAYVFTPESFRVALETAINLNILDLEIVKIYETAFLSIEFIVILRKKINPAKVISPAVSGRNI
jgi:2-polyprenyl-3-methyl-5-hydroxy-6-metoxy-1,4-benzoquinol methylase